MMNLEKIVSAVVDLANQTGKFIRQERLTFQPEKIEYKGKNDLVSYVDKAAEEQLVSGLSAIWPGSGFITEENTVAQTDAEVKWIIDPLDGTTNFIHNFSPYAVSIGLMIGNELKAGVIYEVTRDEMFYGWTDGGAYLNQKRISISSVNKLNESLLSTGFPYYNFEKLDQYLAILNQLMKQTHGLRRIGSAATDLANVACGRFDGFFEYNLNSWDVAAGIVLVKEAGGKVSDFKGEDNCLFGKEIVAGGNIHPELLAVIQQYWHI